MLEPPKTTRLSFLGGVAVAAGVAVVIFVVFRLGAQKPGNSRLPENFRYQLPSAAKAPAPNLYREQAPLPLPLKHPTALAVSPDDALYVGGDKQVLRLNKTGRVVKTVAVGGRPTCLAADEQRRVYVGLFDHLKIYTDELRKLASWHSLGSHARLTSVTAGDGNVFVADAGNRVVVHYDDAGRLLGRIGANENRDNAPRFVIPSPYFDVALGADGLLWVVNPGRTRVEAYTLSGNFELAWGKPSVRPAGFSGCCNPAHFAVDPTGGFVTSEKGLVRLKHYDASGVFEGMIAGPEQLTGAPPGKRRLQPLDVAVDSAGRIFALDASRRQVRIFAKKASRLER